MNMKYKYFLFVFFIWIGLPEYAEAEEKGQISVQAVLPDNQYDKENTYFDLMIDQGEKQTVQINIYNGGTETAEIEVYVHSAYTNEDGKIEYGRQAGESDPSLKYNLEEIIKTEKRVMVPGKGTYTLDLEIQMPEEEVNGILAGGITIQKAEETETEKGKSDSIQIINEYSYLVGVVLRNNEKEVLPQLNLRYITADNTGSSTVIKVNLQNERAMYMGEMVVEAQITKKGEKEILSHVKTEDRQMAPNSNFDYVIDMAGTKLDEGTYTLFFNAACGSKSWNWKETFKIKEKGISEEELVPDSYGWIYLIMGIAVACICAGGGLLVKKRNSMAA